MVPTVKVQLLAFAGCPNREPARNVVLAVLEHYPAATFQEFDVNATETPTHLRQWGSPTILVNGEDVAGQEATGPSCRLYEDHLADNRGVPSIASIRIALEEASK